jgi:hypothetical protein
MLEQCKDRRICHVPLEQNQWQHHFQRTSKHLEFDEQVLDNSLHVHIVYIVIGENSYMGFPIPDLEA